MSEPSPRTDLLSAKYRGEYAPIPLAQSLDQLGIIIEKRVKPGLVKLLGRTSVSPVEYGGYALTSYSTPLEMIEIFNLFGGQETINALRNAGLNVNTESEKDDFWVEYFQHFDRMQNSYRNGVWTQGQDETTGLRGLSGTNFLLGPVVRGPMEIFRSDRFNQHIDTDFAHASAVYVTGHLLMQGLYEYEPELREGWAIPSKIIADFFSERFDMRPLVQRPTTFAS